ncbi:MAG: hypothetical protein R2732_07930 [Microbacteriaceae bacterium]
MAEREAGAGPGAAAAAARPPANTASRRTLARRLRVAMVWVIVASFGLAAISGIAVLLGGGLGETGGRVLATTALVGAFSVAVLCCLALVGRRQQWFGFVGAGVAALTLIDALVWVWSANPRWDDAFYRWLGTGISATIACSFACLLLLLAHRRRSEVRAGLALTLALFAIVLGMIWYLIWFDGGSVDDDFFRALGIVGILAALGAIVVPVLSLLLREPATGEAGEPSGAHAAAVAAPLDAIPPALARALHAAAARRGVSVEALVAPLLGGGGDGIPVPPSAPAPPQP